MSALTSQPAIVGRAKRISTSANFKNGSFVNLSATQMKPADVSWLTMLGKSLRRPKDTRPAHALSSVKRNFQSPPDLLNTTGAEPVITWFGHSSYLVQIGSKNILVDPVFSGHASPFSFMVKAFDGANTFGADDMPPVDVLIITHDHYDHLDVETVRKLAPKVRNVITALGVGAVIEKLIPLASIHELDWWESVSVENMHFSSCPARHFSGRSLIRNKALWSAFAIQCSGYNIFAGGDSGYDFFFKEIGERFGPFDIAMLECGQYNEMWPMIHMMPEETAQAAVDLQAKWLLPVHWSKFALGLHPWNEPVKRLKLAAEKLSLNVTTPRIGQPVVIGSSYPQETWWIQ